MLPTVDIICLVHNQLHITKGFIKSLFENTENFNLIFINNGSNEETYDFLENGKNKWKVIHLKENIGIIKGRNLGAKNVESEYFLNIDNDQYPKKGWLESLFSLINKGYDVVGSEAWSLLPPKSSGLVNIGKESINDRTYFPHHRCTSVNEKFTYIGCGGMLIKKDVYKNIGLFDERFSPAYFEDPDYSFNLIQTGYKIGWQPKCSIDHLAHQTINSQNLFNINKQFLKSWKLFKDKWFPYYPEQISMKGVI